MEKVILKCERLCKKIGSKNIINNVSIDLEESEILGIIGPNGAGKTTTIKLILGLQSLTSGKVLINGYDLKKDFKKAIERVGAIVENPDFYTYLSGYRNLKLVADLYPNIDNKRIDEVVKLVGLENRIKDSVSKYSLGMKQRLGIATAIINKPNLLILDEPTNGLDPEGIAELRKLLKTISSEENIGIIISSHNLSEIDSICTKVCIMQKGELIEENDIYNLKEENDKYIIKVNDTNNVKKLMKNEKIDVIDNTTILVEKDKEDIFSFAKKLDKENIKVYEIIKETKTLEEAFLERTGGNKID